MVETRDCGLEENPWTDFLEASPGIKEDYTCAQCPLKITLLH